MENNENKTPKKQEMSLLSKLIPFSLTVFAILFDQITKILVNAKLPLENGNIYNPDKIPVIGNDILNIFHVRNNAVAFSIGHNLPDRARTILFSIIPLIVIIGLCFIIVKSNDLTKTQRWAVSGIIGGGIGNIIDRIFRPMGVVDFIDFKWFNIPKSWDRFPTFNIADCFVTVCAVLFVVTIIVKYIKSAKEKKEAKEDE